MLYDTASNSPRPGTIKEAVFLMVNSMRRDAEFQSQLLNSFSALTAGSESEGAYVQLRKQMETYISTHYPYMKNHMEDEGKKMRQILHKEMEVQAYKVAREEAPWRRGK